MEPPTPGEVWVDERVLVGRSAIEGRGLFAADDIPNGAVVVRLGGRLVTPTELAELLATAARDAGAPYVDTITVHDDAHLVLPPGTVVHFGNHSCDPTLWHVSDYELATRRRVACGEELTVDYATNSGVPGFAMECRCRAPRCRGRVTGDDWRLPELQARYGHHWTSGLRDRIDRGGAGRCT